MVKAVTPKLKIARHPTSVLLAIVFVTTMARAGVLEIVVRDEAGGSLPCRVLVRSEAGDCVVPEGATELRIGLDRWFVSPGKSQVSVPDGSVLLRVERGLEYRRVKESLRVSGTKTSRNITLQRWVDMRSRGYLCGENHLHVDSAKLGPMLVAEGLDFGTSLTWWNGPDHRVPVPLGSGQTRVLRYAGREVPTTVHDAELEYSWGAAYIQNLPEAMPIASNREQPNLDYLKHAVGAGAIVHYQGGWSREVAVDALLGYVHTINVCNNNFHLHRFQPRRMYSNLLEVEEFPEYENTDRGMMEMNTDTYYRLLNWGLPLAAGAGSATGVKEVPVGYNRAYVRAPSDASIEEFNSAWARGRNFVTNGPMLFLKTGDGKRPGDTVELPAEGGRLRVDVGALSDQTLIRVEVVVNGKVVKDFSITDGSRTFGTVELQIDNASWIAARCTARDDLLSDAELAAYANKDRQQPSRLRFAHTSPIQVTVGGRQVAVDRSIEEGLRMLARFEVFARKTASATYVDDILEATREARSKLEARRAVAAASADAASADAASVDAASADAASADAASGEASLAETAPVKADTEQRRRTVQLPDSVRLEPEIDYAATGNPRHRLDLLLPKERSTAAPLPIIAFIHGGAWRGGNKRAGISRLAPFVAGGSYAAASIGYRLSGEAVWPAQIHDCKAAIRWIRAHAKEYNLDPDRIAVWGTSAGGHLVSMLGTSGGIGQLEGNLGAHGKVKSRVTCVVDAFGPTDLLAMSQYPSRIDHDAPDSPESQLVGGPLQDHKAAARSASPSMYVSPDDAAFFIVHGTDDTAVPFNQSERLAAALRKAEVTTVFVTVEGGGHGGFRSPELDYRIAAFFEKHLRGRETDVSDAPLRLRQEPTRGAEVEGHVIDLTYPFSAETVYWPTSKRFELTQVAYGHDTNGRWYAANDFSTSEHGGTHIDAPIHFALGGRATDEIPLTQLMGPARVIDIRTACAADRDYLLSAADIRAHEAGHGRIAPGSVVLVHTGFGKYYPDAERYLGSAERGNAEDLHFPGIGAEAARLLVGRQVDLVGIDTASLDHGPSRNFAAHRIFSQANVPGLENVAHLDQVPPQGATVIALPMKIEGGTGGPCRIIAILP